MDNDTQENIPAQPELIASDKPKKRGRPKKIKETEVVETPEQAEAKEPETAFEFSDDDVQEFKKWKQERELRNQTVDRDSKHDALIEAWKEDSRLVKGIFRCREPAGGSVSFFFRKYKFDPTVKYDMVDGEEYTIPLGVAKHLNHNCNYPVHSHILGADGQPVLNTGKMESRMNFESLEFAGV